MRPSSSSPDQPRCIVCGASLLPQAPFCTSCGARQEETPAERLRGVDYLLGELTRWEATGLISSEQASRLRGSYEETRAHLRAQLSPPNGEHAPIGSPAAEQTTQQTAEQPEIYEPLRRKASDAGSAPPEPPPLIEREPRSLIETLTDPHNLRLLLYTGAAMIIVSVVLWLRDVLYLKLQEPVVQAGLLATGTLGFMASGWYTSLRTRQRLTGRALTLIGSVLVPVNFWFLVRSGLIENHGRAWMVCALCTVLYATTAALLRERLYVYLASLACVATGWALVFRFEREAYGLYALVCMLAAQIFLHLSRLFQRAYEEQAVEDEGRAGFNGPEFQVGHFSYELWSRPLVQAGLFGAALSALCYLLLRLAPGLSFEDGLLHLTANSYDPGTAVLLFTAWAYALWFVGRFIYTDRRALSLTLSSLALVGALILALDGLRVEAESTLFALSVAALATALLHRLAHEEESSRGMYITCLLVSLSVIVFAPTTILPDFLDGVTQLRNGATAAFLAASFALLSGPRFSMKGWQALLAYFSALFASTSFVLAVSATHARAEWGFAACAAWPFALWLGAGALRRRSLEPQLATPFRHTADAEFVLLFIISAFVAMLLYLDQKSAPAWRWPIFCVLLAAGLYGALRTRGREGAAFGAELSATALLVLTASFADALKWWGALPGRVPIAALVISAAFLLPKASALWLSAQRAEAGRAPLQSVRLATDLAVLLCGVMWLADAVFSPGSVGFAAPFVLLLALLYWAELAWRGRSAWATDTAFACAGALLFALLAALRVEMRWFTLLFALTLPPVFFLLARAARARGNEWLAGHAQGAAWVSGCFIFAASLLQALPHLRPGDELLLAPCLTTGVLALLFFGASVAVSGSARVRYFRAGLLAAIVSFALACLRAGFDPWADLEIYTSPVAVVMLLVAYLSVRREWEEYERDTGALLWLGSLTLCAPLLFHALEFRLMLDQPAPWRDLGVLCASVALILFGTVGRLRAPMQVGVVTLLTELLVLTVTSVHWTQVPLKVYLITVGSMLALAGWMLEFRREQLMRMRDRLNQHRETARDRFGEWR